MQCCLLSTSDPPPSPQLSYSPFHTSFRVWSQYHRLESHYFLAGRRHCSALSRVGPAAQYKPYVVVAEEYNGSSSANSESIGWEWSNKTRTSILWVQISVFLFPYPFLEDQRSWAGAKVMKLAAHCRRCMLHACMHAADPHDEICNCFKWKNSTTKTLLDHTWTYPETTSQNSSSSLNSLMCTTSSTEIVQTAIMPSCQLHAHCMLLASSHDHLQLQQKQKKIFSKKIFYNICFPLISWWQYSVIV